MGAFKLILEVSYVKLMAAYSSHIVRYSCSPPQARVASSVTLSAIIALAALTNLAQNLLLSPQHLNLTSFLGLSHLIP